MLRVAMYKLFLWRKFPKESKNVILAKNVFVP